MRSIGWNGDLINPRQEKSWWIAADQRKMYEYHQSVLTGRRPDKTDGFKVIYRLHFDRWLACCFTETPVSIIKKLADVRVEEGSPVTLECEFSRQNVEVKWLKVKNEQHQTPEGRKPPRTKWFSTWAAWPQSHVNSDLLVFFMRSYIKLTGLLIK